MDLMNRRLAPARRMRRIRVVLGPLVPIVLMAIAPAHGTAQETIATVLQRAFAQVTGEPIAITQSDDPRTEYRRIQSGNWSRMSDQLALGMNSQIRLTGGPVSARVRISTDFARGTIAFTPSPLDPGGAGIVVDTIVITPGSQGLYSFVADTLEDFAVQLESGAMMVDWESRTVPLIVLIVGERVEILGTDVLFTQGVTANRALIYVSNGTAFITGPPRTQLVPGTVYLVGAGLVGAVALAGASAEQLGLFASRTEYLKNGIWPSPVPPTPGLPLLLKAVAIVGAVGGGGYLIYNEVKGGGSKRQDITIRVPLPFRIGG